MWMIEESQATYDREWGRLILLTGNQGKYNEFRALLPGLRRMELDLPEIQSLDVKEIIAAKIAEAFRHMKGNFLVEDTSLFAEGLKGLPGPLVKWFLQALGVAGLAELVLKSGSTRAEARVVLGYACKSGCVIYFEAALRGTIVAPAGTEGFGWDFVFQPEGFARTLAEMSPETKNSISMRGAVTQKLKEYIRGE